MEVIYSWRATNTGYPVCFEHYFASCLIKDVEAELLWCWKREGMGTDQVNRTQSHLLIIMWWMHTSSKPTADGLSVPSTAKPKVII